MAARINVDEEAERILPLDGPYTPEAIRDTAVLIGELVRHLNHATMPDNADLSPADIDSTVAGLERAISMLPQALRQLSQKLATHGEDPALRADGLSRTGFTPQVIARIGADLLRDDVTAGLTAAHTSLGTARNFTARLYLNSTEAEAE